MIIVTNTYVRPSTDVDFYVAPVEQSDEFMNRYRETGKALSTVKTLSADTLTAIVSTKWVTRAEFNAFLADPLSVAMRSGRTSYCEANGIINTMVVTHEPSEGDMEPSPS